VLAQPLQLVERPERTVKTISHDIATKLGARTRTQAVARAVRAGII
jgi:DNA-binding NarL/FixJ family response regulator